MEARDMAYKYVHFNENVEWHKGKKRKTYICWGSAGSDCLGEVSYYPRWHQFIFEPSINARGCGYSIALSKECLENIADFLGKLNKEYRNGKF